MKRRTLKAKLRRSQERIDELEQRVSSLTRQLLTQNRCKVQEVEHPIATFKISRTFDARFLQEQPEETVRQVIAAGFLDTTDENGNHIDSIVDCIRYRVGTDCSVPWDVRRAIVTAELQVLNLNNERRTYFVL